jgi:L-lactate dehydrogenase complex protein LldF
MGAVLTPLLSGGTEGRDLPDASSLCGACSEVCPVGIPLADMLVRLRADLRSPGPAVPPAAPWPGHEADPGAPVGVEGDAPGDSASRSRAVRRLGFGAWARLWASPTGYRLSATAARHLGRLAPPALMRRAPMVSGWGEGRDIPLPAARSFRQRLAHRTEEGW